MEWWVAAALLLGGVIALIMVGLPVAFAFWLIVVGGGIVFFGGEQGLRQIILSMWSSISSFTLVAIPLFILMGEVMFRSKIAGLMLDTLDKNLGALPGRLALVAVSGATLFATMSGSAMATSAMLGAVLAPEMEERGYKKAMSLGPIIGSGGLAIMIPPSNLAVLLATIAYISVGGLLIAIIIPGLLMAALYATYIILRCSLQPSVAPSYKVTLPPLSQRVALFARYVLPLGAIILSVLGTMFFGVATPSEAAALGAIVCFILALIYKRLNWQVAKGSVADTLKITGMIMLILTGSAAFSQLLAFTGVTRGIASLVNSTALAPILIIIMMQIVVLIMGCFMDPISIMMVVLPIYMPIVLNLGFNPLWFGAIMLLNFEIGESTPPFGMLLFVMKGVAPPGTTMGDIIRAGLPFIGCDLILMVLMLAFPGIVLWLPGLTRGT